MFFLALSVFAVAAMVFALGDGAASASNGRLAFVWIAGVVALHSFSTTVLLVADRDWDDPASPNLLGPYADQIVAVANVGLVLALALALRRRAVLYLALAALPLLALYWSPAFF